MWKFLCVWTDRRLDRKNTNASDCHHCTGSQQPRQSAHHLGNPHLGTLQRCGLSIGPPVCLHQLLRDHSQSCTASPDHRTTCPDFSEITDFVSIDSSEVTRLLTPFPQKSPISFAPVPRAHQFCLHRFLRDHSFRLHCFPEIVQLPCSLFLRDRWLCSRCIPRYRSFTCPDLS